jgi:AcrR family transcriptional regulator
LDHTTPNNALRSGRPRDPDIEERVIQAAFKILGETGFHGLSFAKISSLSGVARPTLKLRWHTREDICIDAIKYILDLRDDLIIPENLAGEDIRQLIIVALESLIRALNTPETMRILASILSAAHFSEPLGELRQYVLSRRGFVLRRLLEAGIENGQFAKSTDIEFALDALNGPILYRTIVLGLPMDPDTATPIVDLVLPRLA